MATHNSVLAARKLHEDIADGVIAVTDCETDEAMGRTDCPEGCVVEPDGQCPHGWNSAAVTAGLI